MNPGELVPSVRDLAKQLAVNPNTVARAYRELQQVGVLQTVRGTGLAVTPNAKDHCVEQRRRLVQERIDEALLEGLRSGIGADELLAHCGEALNHMTTKGNGA